MTKSKPYNFIPEREDLFADIERAIKNDSRYNSIRQWLEQAAEEKLKRETKKEK